MATYTGSDKRLQYLFRASGNLAEDYNDTSTYAVGDFAIVDGVLKKCITAVSTPESYDSTKWTDALITDEMGGGGGTTVIANPSGTPTDDLDTIQIGSTIYDIVGGGGGPYLPFNIRQISRETPTITLATNTTNTIKRMTIEKAGYYILSFVDTYNRNNNRSYFIVSGTANEVVIYNSGNNALTDTWYDGSGYSTFSHLVFLRTLVDNAIIDLKMWGNGYSPNSAAITLFKFEGSIIELASCYSTEERQVGCWTDGKPLYQKTIYSSGGSLTSGQIQISNNLANIDHVVSWKCTTHDTSRDRDYCLDHNRLDATEDIRLQVFVASDDTVALTIIVTKTTFLTAIGDTWITLQYTKTTDTAGSGIWTPQGSYAHHYSTAEQVIGTWTDGSTLYEKTLHIPFSDTSTDGVQRVYSIANALPNTVIRNVFGIATSASYGYCSLGSMCYRQNTQSGAYWQFYWYYNLLALRASDGITTLNNSIKPDIDVTVQYTKAA